MLENILHLGRSVVAHVASAKIFGAMLETLAERVLFKARHRHRMFEQLDHVRAGSIDQKADGVMHMNAENMFMSADNAVRVNASQIHMGRAMFTNCQLAGMDLARPDVCKAPPGFRRIL
jgi:hypothetical protein